MKFSNILLCVNNSPFSLKVIEHGLEMATRLQQGEGKTGIVLVVESALAVEGGVTPGELRAELKREGQAFLEKALALHQEKGIFTFVVEGDSVYKTILETAQDFDADVLVIGSHGRTGINRILMGSVAEEVVRHAAIPVVIVPEKVLA